MDKISTNTETATSGHREYPRYKVAAIQAGSVVKDAPLWFDLEATLDKAVGLIEEAGRNEARLIVFPECFLPCFPYWSLDLVEEFMFNEIWAKYLASSIEVPSKETEALCAAAKRANAYVAMGINERSKKYPAECIIPFCISAQRVRLWVLTIRYATLCRNAFFILQVAEEIISVQYSRLR